jgi:mannose-6-phosphate isomerase
VFVPARTVHAIAAGCLLWEVQQTADITFRVDDWGRVGLDGKPRPLHVAESLSTIDFDAGPVVPSDRVDCDYFEASRVDDERFEHDGGRCTIVITLGRAARVQWEGGERPIAPMSVALLPAALRRATVLVPEDGILVARPRL